MATNHTIVDHTGETATVEADFTATHRIDDDRWVLGGRYTYETYELTVDDEDWKVSTMTMTALWET